MKDETWLRTSNELEAICARERLFVDMCGAWLRFLLTAGPRRVAYLRQEVDEHLSASEYLERAGKVLGVVEYQVDGRRWWRLPTNS